LYPALNVPVLVTDLAAVERGDGFDITFTIPSLTTEGLQVTSLGSIDLRLGPNNLNPFRVERWAASATHETIPSPDKPGPVQARIPLHGLVGQEVVFAVRISNAKGRFSEWSNLFTVTVVPPLEKPSALAWKNIAEGVRLTWSAPNEPAFHIFRKETDDPEPSQTGASDKPEYTDTTAVPGKTYQYWIQGVHDKAESEAAGPITATPKDEFPPAVPSNITATAGLNAIELSWSRNEEPDFHGYRVYRALGDGAFELVAADIQPPNYSDKAVEAGKRYRYAITAVDETGNESNRSQIVEATAP
jgi:fibronectin type 3 domain-containing protein